MLFDIILDSKKGKLFLETVLNGNILVVITGPFRKIWLIARWWFLRNNKKTQIYKIYILFDLAILKMEIK